MKIGIIVTNFRNSIFPDIAKSLADMGQEVIVFTDDSRAPDAKDFLHFHENGIEFFVINNKKRYPLFIIFDKLFKKITGTGERRFFTLLFFIYRFIKKNKDCDIFIVEWDWTGFFVAIVNLFLSFRWMIGVHDLNNLKISIEYHGRENKWWLYKIKHWVYKQADIIRANSYVTEKFLIESGCNPEKIKVIPLHITRWMMINPDEDIREFRQYNREEIFNKYNIEKNNKLLITMCNLKPVKGLELAILALPYILKKNPNIILMMCGDDRIIKGIGSYQRYLENLAQKIGVRQNIVFTGFVPIEEVKKYLSAADIHLAPSVVDTFNYAVIESAIVGTFSIVSSNVGSAYWVKKEKLCEIIYDRKPEVWADAILKHLNQSEQIDTTGFSRQLLTQLQPQNIAEHILKILT